MMQLFAALIILLVLGALAYFVYKSEFNFSTQKAVGLGVIFLVFVSIYCVSFLGFDVTGTIGVSKKAVDALKEVKEIKQQMNLTLEQTVELLNNIPSNSLGMSGFNKSYLMELRNNKEKELKLLNSLGSSKDKINELLMPIQKEINEQEKFFVAGEISTKIDRMRENQELSPDEYDKLRSELNEMYKDINIDGREVKKFFNEKSLIDSDLESEINKIIGQ